MPGLSLRAGLGAGMNGSTAGGLTPMPAATATGPRRSTRPAWGYAAGGGPGYGAAAIGGVATSIIATVLLAWLWWSLPR